MVRCAYDNYKKCLQVGLTKQVKTKMKQAGCENIGKLYTSKFQGCHFAVEVQLLSNFCTYNSDNCFVLFRMIFTIERATHSKLVKVAKRGILPFINKCNEIDFGI